MALAQIIPFTAEAAGGSGRQHKQPTCTVLTSELANKLKMVNEMSRRLRAAGVRVKETSPLEASLLIHTEDSDNLAVAFGSEWRGVSWSTKGNRTLNSVRLGGCRICWLTPVKEQDQ